MPNLAKLSFKQRQNMVFAAWLSRYRVSGGWSVHKIYAYNLSNDIHYSVFDIGISSLVTQAASSISLVVNNL